MSIFVGGQSLAKIFLEHNPGEFTAAVAALAPEISAPSLWGYAVGSTIAASTNIFPETFKGGRQYWWDMKADLPGPLLDRALEIIDSHDDPAVAMFWDLGQHEAVIARGRMGRVPEDVLRDFRYATLRCLTTLRKRLRPKAPGSLPILLMRIGPMKGHPKFDMSGIERIRAAQRDIISLVPNCHDAGDISGMELIKTVHPTVAGSKYYLRVVAETFVRVMQYREASAA